LFRKKADLTALRVSKDGNATETAVQTYANKNRTVTLIGVRHAGTRSYYLAVRNVIDGLEDGGAVVHYEGINYPRHWDSDSDYAAPFINLYRARGELMAALGTRIVDQHSSVLCPPGDAWVDVDISPDTLGRMLDEKGIISAMPGRAAVIDDLTKLARNPDPEVAKEARIAFRIQYLKSAEPGMRDVANQKMGAEWDIVVDWRSDRASEAIASHPGDVVSFWGCGHLPRMGQTLLDSGFELREVEWLTVAEWGDFEPVSPATATP
jgi:hypothetical protein